ncbi:MAG TPA: DUF6588 family protein [Candidatus Kryptonia bacterium]
MRKTISAVMVVFVLAGFANAQDLGSSLGKVASPYAQAYVAPFVNSFGVDMNSGLFHGATMTGLLPLGLHLYIGVQVGAAFVGSADKSFSLSYEDTEYITIGGVTTAHPATVTAQGPTIFGDKTPGSVTYTPHEALLPTTTQPTIGGLVSTSIAPLPIPQLGLGTLFGTDVMVRFLPKIKLSSYGSLQLFGFTIRHSISQYIPLVPVDVAVQLGIQNFSIKDSTGGNLLKTSAFAANVEVSKTFAILTIYGGLQYESSSVDFTYSFTPNPGATPIPVSFNMKGKNHFRVLAGLSLGLGPLTINGDYDLGAVSSATVGVGFSI